MPIAKDHTSLGGQRFLSISANTVDQYGHQGIEHPVQTKQLSAGSFISREDTLLHPDLTIRRRTVNQLIHQQGIFKNGYLTIVLHPGDHCCYSKGSYFGQGHVSMVAGMLDWEAITKPGTTHHILIVKIDSLAKYLPQELLSLLNDFVNSESRFALHMDDFYEVTKRACDRSLQLGGVETLHELSDSIFEEMRRDILHIVGYFLRNGKAESVRANSTVRLLDKAMDFIGENLQRSLKVSDLASSLHTTRRALEKAFDTYLHISPKEYIKCLKLNAIRLELLYRDDQGHSISAIARRYSITHMGHFSRSYEKMFNELPSQTVFRARRPI